MTRSAARVLQVRPLRTRSSSWLILNVSCLAAYAHSIMNTTWQNEFRTRMEQFGASKVEGFIPVSLKVRVESGCFHREHSPEAYRLIDQYLSGLGKPEVPFKFEEHESGPEILVYLAVTTAGLSLAKSVVELLTAIVKARSEGIKKGDRPSHPVEVIVRGHWEDGN